MEQETTAWGSEEPLYNIGAVVRMTGIPEATLRVWERRYSFPQPARTSGSHRLYSESQVRQLRWIKTRLDDGMQIRQAVQALRRMERDDVLDTLPAHRAAGRAAGDPSLAALYDRLLVALLAHQLEVADQVLGEAMALHPLEDLILQVIRPALAEIGHVWQEGQATVATEHLATHFMRHRLLMWMLTGVRPHSIQPIILACAPGEWHEGSLLILGALLRRRRWPIAYLGQSVPLPDLAALAEDIRPPAIVLVAMTEEPARALTDWPRWLPAAADTGRPLVAFGGLIFSEQPEWQRRVPGRFLGASLEEGVEALDRWLRTAALPLTGSQPPD